MATTQPTDERAKQTADPEHKAMIAVQKAFGELDDEARERVLVYLNSRYGKKATTKE